MCFCVSCFVCFLNEPNAVHLLIRSLSPNLSKSPKVFSKIPHPSRKSAHQTEIGPHQTNPGPHPAKNGAHQTSRGPHPGKIGAQGNAPGAEFPYCSVKLRKRGGSLERKIPLESTAKSENRSLFEPRLARLSKMPDRMSPFNRFNKPKSLMTLTIAKADPLRVYLESNFRIAKHRGNCDQEQRI